MAGTTRTGLGAVRLAARALGRKVPKSRRAVSLSVLIGAVIAALAGALIAVTVPARPNRPEADREALWKIVHDRCEFGYRRTGAYAPCTFVDEQSGTALYKADFDPYQFLLIPLARITGIEDPALRESAGRNYLYDAWAARFLVTARLNNSTSRVRRSPHHQPEERAHSGSAAHPHIVFVTNNIGSPEERGYLRVRWLEAAPHRPRWSQVSRIGG